VTATLFALYVRRWQSPSSSTKNRKKK